MQRRPLTVLKLGGSVLRDEADLPEAVHEAYRWSREGPVVVVVSAFQGVTDTLLAQARRCTSRPDAAALAALVATGEHAAAALLGLALDRAGVPATVLDAPRLGLLTRGPRLEAEPVAFDVAAVRGVLDRGGVAVVPGFLGRAPDGGPSLLGRGGSDLTALFLADRLAAGRCRLVKDVGGLYDRDPASAPSGAGRYARLTWDDALRLGGRAVQGRALGFARERRLAFEVAALDAAAATLVGPGPASLTAPHPAQAPLRVGLLGFGSVGVGVYRHLARRPDRFAVVGIAVRDPQRRRDDVPPGLTTDAAAVVDAADLVVEALPGEEPAASLLRRALAAGKRVVSANKALLAAHGPELDELEERHGGRLRFSAAVGGAVPVLETARRLAGPGLKRIDAVLNGTTGFVLDRIAEGMPLEDALRLAQAQGLAEADPSRDLEGCDVEAKLRILARAAFGREAEVWRRRGIGGLDAARVRASARDGVGLRLVGRLARGAGGGVLASVAPEPIPASHPLSGLRDEENGAVFIHDEAHVVLRGRGAGRWPTAEAVLADVLDLARERPSQRAAEEVPA